ncbi:sensor domain-containing diguanylate cyclase [Raoultibacter phocaeensis]|uniref:sensor domain-containing diguanylate cyclase n=1 Tax=Raoultibacter phocaeensis TaxID=2479841 RepID=UPI0015D60C94|nr:sensor domain-containing diguanylate cyclase [Raoultibacter phocaeensis]
MGTMRKSGAPLRNLWNRVRALAGSRAAEQHKRDMERYASVLCSVYDEVVEYDCVRGLCCVIYSAHQPVSQIEQKPLAEALERWLSHIPDQADRDGLIEAIDACAESSREQSRTCSYRFQVGERSVWCQTTFLRVSHEYILWCNKDVSEHMFDEDRRASARISDIVSKLPVGVGVYRYFEGGSYPLYLSDRMCALFGRSREEYNRIIASGDPLLLTDSLISFDQAFDMEAALQNGMDYEFEFERAGETVNVRLQGRAVRESDGGIEVPEGHVILYIVATDVTDEVRTRKAASWNNERYRILSELTHAISFDYDVDADAVLLYLDRTGKGMEAQVIPSYFETMLEKRRGVVHPDSVEAVHTMFARVREGSDGGAIEYQADYYGLGYAWYRTNLFVVHDAYGSRHLVGLIENIQNEFDLRKRAELDETTGLTNHATAKELVNLALADPATRTNSICAVLDIDDFKLVNDTCGHIEGDALLHEVGSVLRSSFRETDVIGRVGGDEFVLLLKNIDLDIALSKLHKVTERVAAYALPCSGYVPSLSIGVYKIKSDDMTYRDAFVKADDALYRAKRAGKNRIVVYGFGNDDAVESAPSADS